MCVYIYIYIYIYHPVNGAVLDLEATAQTAQGCRTGVPAVVRA